MRKELLFLFTRFTVGLPPGLYPHVSHIPDIPEINVPKGYFPEKRVIPGRGLFRFNRVLSHFRLFWRCFMLPADSRLSDSFSQHPVPGRLILPFLALI